MPSLGQLVPAQSWATIPYGPSAVKVAYRPGAVTPRFQKAVLAAQVAGNLDGSLLEPLCALIAAWDITDEDGALVEITPAGLEAIPLPVLFAILEGITADMAPNRSRAGDSANGSSPSSGSAPAPTGTSS